MSTADPTDPEEALEPMGGNDPESPQERDVEGDAGDLIEPPAPDSPADESSAPPPG